MPYGTTRHWLAALLDEWDEQHSSRKAQRERRFRAVLRKDKAVESMIHAARYIERTYGFTDRQHGQNAHEACCIIACCLARVM